MAVRVPADQELGKGNGDRFALHLARSEDDETQIHETSLLSLLVRTDILRRHCSFEAAGRTLGHVACRTSRAICSRFAPTVARRYHRLGGLDIRTNTSRNRKCPYCDTLENYMQPKTRQ